MGLFWDLVQQAQLASQHGRAGSLEKRVNELELELLSTQELLRTLIERLETHFGQDFDGDDAVS